MASFDPANSDVVFLVASAGKGALTIAKRAEKLVAQGNQVNVIATPTAAQWIDSDAVETITGWPTRSEMRTPNELTFQPLAGRVLATPVTLNTLTKWAQGHADNLAVGLLCEALGMGIPIEAEIQLSAAYVAHPATMSAVEVLRKCGVTVRAAESSAPLDRPSGQLAN